MLVAFDDLDPDCLPQIQAEDVFNLSAAAALYRSENHFSLNTCDAYREDRMIIVPIEGELPLEDIQFLSSVPLILWAREGMNG